MVAPPFGWFALALLAISVGMVAFVLASVVMPGFELLPDRPSPINVIVVLCTFVTLPSVGAVLAILRPRNPIGWLFLVASIGFTMGIFSTEYVTRSTVLGANLPGYALVDWIGAWAGMVALWAAIVFIPIVFPDGHPLGPRWRLVAWAAVIAFGLTIAALAVQPTGPIMPSGPTGYAGRLPNPIAVGGPLADIATPSLICRFCGLRGPGPRLARPSLPAVQGDRAPAAQVVPARRRVPCRDATIGFATRRYGSGTCHPWAQPPAVAAASPSSATGSTRSTGSSAGPWPMPS